MSAESKNTYPKLHNATWPGLVGKGGPDAEPVYEHTFIHQFADFLQSVGACQEAAPTFRDGSATDCVTDAVLKSARTRKWEAVSK